MKIMKLTSAFALVLTLVAAQFAFTVSPVYADYTHSMTVSAGSGTFTDGTDEMNLVTGATTAHVDSNATSVKVGGKTYDIKTMPDGLAPEDSKYFVRGLKVAGDDNANAIVGDIDIATGQGHLGNQDVELVVAYGLKSNMAQYTVNYLEYGTNAALAGSETHYGVVGDKPVVSFKYFDGYLPRDLNITGTIAEDGSTLFTFYYYKVDLNGNIIIINDGGPDGGGGAGGAGAAGDNAGTNIGDNDTPLANGPNDLVDIDNGQTPTSDGTDIDDNKTPGANWPLVVGGAALLVALAAALLILLRRRRENEEA